MQCFKCEKVLTPVFPDTPAQPNGAVVFSSRGHYGSTVWDENYPGSDKELILYLCDFCLVERKTLVFESFPLIDNDAHHKFVCRNWDFPDPFEVNVENQV